MGTQLELCRENKNKSSAGKGKFISAPPETKKIKEEKEEERNIRWARAAKKETGRGGTILDACPGRRPDCEVVDKHSSGHGEEEKITVKRITKLALVRIITKTRLRSPEASRKKKSAASTSSSQGTSSGRNSSSMSSSPRGR